MKKLPIIIFSLMLGIGINSQTFSMERFGGFFKSPQKVVTLSEKFQELLKTGKFSLNKTRNAIMLKALAQGVFQQAAEYASQVASILKTKLEDGTIEKSEDININNYLKKLIEGMLRPSEQVVQENFNTQESIPLTETESQQVKNILDSILLVDFKEAVENIDLNNLINQINESLAKETTTTAKKDLYALINQYINKALALLKSNYSDIGAALNRTRVHTPQLHNIRGTFSQSGVLIPPLDNVIP